MNIQILHSHLLEYLDTKASPSEIARCLSLCGPSVERVKKLGRDYAYDIEVTTNRVDTASVLGIAREAAAILPQFGINASFKKPKTANFKFPENSLPLTLKSDPKLVKRLTAVIVEDIKVWATPTWMKERLEAAGIRSLNAVIDITNYVMIETGHPAHVFDYDKIKDHTITVRESKKGEKVTTLDGKTYALHGGDVVFVDTDNKIIDLPGIMGTKNSVVSKDTIRAVFFFDSVVPVKIRRTSMSLGVRTMAATLNEKNVDPELVPMALNLGLTLFEKVCKVKVASKIYDVYPRPYAKKSVETSRAVIEKILGVQIDKNKIITLLKALEFEPKWTNDKLTIKVPSFRAHDIEIEEDIAEEVARIYGYHNLPSVLMVGSLPTPLFDAPFTFENKVRQTLKGFGGTEVLTYSLVTREMAGAGALKLKNPLGSETEYLRTTLKNSLVEATKINNGITSLYHLFEIANVYLQKKADLPEERMTLAGIFVNHDYRSAKGVLEALFEMLNIRDKIELTAVGKNYYYEFSVAELATLVKPKAFKPIPKYPAQIEDMTIEIPEGKNVGGLIQSIKQASKLVQSVELTDIFERKFTFRISYQHSDKTLSDKEVEEVRGKIEKVI